jgi:hypothetical protein
MPDNGHQLPEVCRREIFLALVNAQDNGKSVGQSRAAIAEQFWLSDEQVRAIEREGIDNDWPPL